MSASIEEELRNAGFVLKTVHMPRRETPLVRILVRAANAESDRGLRANALLYLSHAKGYDAVLVPLGLRFLQSEDGYDRWIGDDRS